MFRVPTHTLYRRSVTEGLVRASVPSTTEAPTFTFITRTGFPPEHSRVRWTPWSVFQDGSFKAMTPASAARNVGRSPDTEVRAEFLNPTPRMRQETITHP